MKTITEMKYKGYIIRVRKTQEVKDGICYWHYDYIAEQWIYREEIDCEELDGGSFGKNMLQAVKNLRRSIDIIEENKRLARIRYETLYPGRKYED
ncbi:hypothetical protein NIES4071_106570 (plasmid) [Calothrix sp. NIES-4071]|nr:hypothetical protein NIES4071_106570 [Calothrix sp. NIES-4071]BAZ65075.1 hypothetical protein NIES4105_108080 [Calothrix sp. NIES-4105]